MPTDDDAPSNADAMSGEDATSSSAGSDDAFAVDREPVNAPF